MSYAIGGGIGGYEEASSSKKRYRKIRNLWRQGEWQAQAAADRLAREAVGSQEFQSLRNYILGAFNDPTSSPVVQNYQQGVRQAQAARGMYFSGGYDEARRVAGLSEMMRMQLIPNLEQLIGYGEKYRQQMFGNLANEYVQRSTSGMAGYNAPGSIGPYQGMTQWAATGAAAAAGQSVDTEAFSSIFGMFGPGGV